MLPVMNASPKIARVKDQAVEIVASACPHDCPSTCALEVERLSPTRIGRVRGAADNDYTAGVICAKVARYAERVHHADRLTRPLLRTGPKGSGQFAEIGWDEALDRVAEAFVTAERRHGAESVWPYYYAGTMGLVQRDGIHRLIHAKKYSRFFGTICVNLAYAGWLAGTGSLRGPDPREIGRSDLVVIWGTNAVNTQINVMTHATRARKERGAKIVCIDPYRNGTAEAADIHLMPRPGTDGALACAVMHVLFRDGHADWTYLEQYTDRPRDLAARVTGQTPEWAEAITGIPAAEIEAFATLVGTTKRAYFRLGYGFSRSRNGAVNMHAAACIAAVTGAYQYEGGGAFHSNGGIFAQMDKTLIEGLDMRDLSVRDLDQSRIGQILTGDPAALKGGPPVTAMLIQNTNPYVVAPELGLVHKGFAREDLFVCVHEQFMTETAKMADVVLPATMFLEHDDIYRGGGNQYVHFGPKVIEAPGEARENHYVICELARRLGVADKHPGFAMTARELADQCLRAGGLAGAEALIAARWHDLQPEFRHAHYLDGFNWPDKRFRFFPDWSTQGPDWQGMPEGPTHWESIEAPTADCPFRLVTAPARTFLNSTFTETPGSLAREKRPTVMVHPDDAAKLGIATGDLVRLGNHRGSVALHAVLFDGMRHGVLIAEGIWPNGAFVEGVGINLLIGSDPAKPNGGAAFHDTAVWLRPA